MTSNVTSTLLSACGDGVGGGDGGSWWVSNEIVLDGIVVATLVGTYGCCMGRWSDKGGGCW